MPTALHLRITNTSTTQGEGIDAVVERTFTRFPVRIGRNTLNDLNIVHRFVSAFHAVIELHDGDKLMLRDLGSSNGTKVSAKRAPAHDPIALAAHNNTFGIGPLVIECSLREVAAADDAPQESVGAVRDDVLEDSFVTNVHETVVFDNAAVADARAKLQAMLQAKGPVGIPRPNKTAAKAEAGKAAPEPEAKKPEPAVSQAPAAPVDPTQPPPPEASKAPPVKEPPAVLKGTLVMPDAAAMQARAQILAQINEQKQRKLEEIALQGVREMARALLPNAPVINEPEDLVRFLSKSRDTLEVFLRAFVPLREGYRQFASQMHIQRGGQDKTAAAIEGAKDERELAQQLLDWTARGGEAHKAVEGTFADLMIHQLALLHAIMKGVKALLDALSPVNVESAFEENAKQGKTDSSWGPWRFKALWRFYAAKHGDMDDGDKRIFAALFGPEFAESYKQYRSTVDNPQP